MRATFEERKQQRFPLGRKMPTLNHFVLFTVILLMILWSIFVIGKTQEPFAKGFWIPIASKYYVAAYADPAGPIIVRIGLSSRISVNGVETKREGLRAALKAKLSRRADRIVFVDGDEDLCYSDAAEVVGVISGLKAKAVLLTPKLKQELARSSTL